MHNTRLIEAKVQINIKDITPGMMIAQTLTNRYGATIIHDRTILTPNLIQKLINLGYNQVVVYELQEEEIEDNKHKFALYYEQSQVVVKEMIKEVGDGRPIDMEKLRSVSSLLLEQSENNRDIIDAIGQVRAASEYTYTHCVNVSLICMLLGKWLKFDEVSIRLLAYTGLLHDIGKSKISNDILDKPGRLSDKEYDIVKQHPSLGYKILEKIPSMNKNVLMGVLMHHERENGSGYPLGARDNQIHYFAKIVAIADIYDAMTSERMYRPKQSPFTVLEMFENESLSLLEPKYLMTFLSNIANYYIGDLVKLNTGETAEIIYINPHHVSRPLVRIDNSYVDLFEEPSLKIVEML